MNLVQYIKAKIPTLLKSKAYQPWILFSFFLLVNLIQGIFTPLLNDEPYYWVYAQNIDLGYFDHPPMIAWLIGLGSTLFKSEIGVRLLPSILGSLTFFLIYKIIEKEVKQRINFKLLFLLLASSIFMNLYSFLAIPDTPLLFFTVLFLWQFQRFLKNESYVNSILLGIIAALLLYSKYHGILVIGFTVLANLRLLKRKSFYIVLATTLLLFVPHILWQFQNDFQTIRFHLSDKGNSFKIKNIFSYIGEQFVITGPVILLLFSILKRTQNKFQYTLKFVSLGIFLFFLISSFRGMVNAYWTLAAWPGMIILSYFYISEIKKNRKLIYLILVFNLVLVIVLRINFLFNISPIPHFNNRNPKEMADQLKLNSEHPLVFENMFIDPAHYLFYQKDSCFAINNITYKKTQFNYLNKLEKSVQGKTVTLVSSSAINDLSRELTILKGKKYFLTERKKFKSYQCNWHVNSTIKPTLTSNTAINIPITVSNRLNNENRPDKVLLAFIMQNRSTKEIYSFPHPITLMTNETINFNFITPSEKGKYKCYFSISNDSLLIFKTFNSNISNITIN